MESEDLQFDTRNKRGTRTEEVLNKQGNGLNMAKKSNNFKEMAKAHKRMMEKRKQQIENKKKERLERREEAEAKAWKDEGCPLEKKMLRKQLKEDKKWEAQQRKKEAQALAEEEMEAIEQQSKAKQRKNK